MNEPVAAALRLLQKKQAFFIEYEAVTDRLAGAVQIADMEKIMDKRDALANSIDEIDGEVKSILQDWSSHVPLLLQDRTQEQALLAELRPLWEICHDIMETVRRIRLKNNDLTQKFRQLRRENLDNIKSTQNQPKISRYLNNLTGPGNGNNFGKV